MGQLIQLQVLTQQLDELPTLKKKRFIADDCSSEALTSLMAANDGRMAVVSTEGGIFDTLAGRYNNKANLDIWLKGHCGDAVYIDRKTREAECIPHPILSAVLTIQPSVLEEVMQNTTMAGRGLLARFLFSFPPSQMGHRTFNAPAISPEAEQHYHALVHRLMDIPLSEKPRRLILSVEAKEMIERYFNEHEQFLVGDGQAMTDWAGKYIGTVLRLSGLLHASEMRLNGSPIITERTMFHAIELGEYFLSQAQYAYNTIGGDLEVTKALFVLMKLRKNKIRQIKRNELYQMCRTRKFFRKSEDIRPTLELLAAHNYITLYEPVCYGVGRPADVVVTVNPEVHGGKV